MPLLEPQQTAGWTYGGVGGQRAISHGRPLPVQAEQETDVFGILDEQYQQEMKDLDMRVAQVQEETLRKTRYELQKLSEKYQTERRYIEGLKVPADQKRQKLLQLNNKYELAAITAKSKVRPEIDVINNQRQQIFTQLQQGYQQKQRDLKLVQKLVDDGVIQDPHAALQEQYAMVGISLPISAFRPPRQLTMEEIAEQQAMLSFQIMNLEEAAKTTTGEDRKTILLQLADLNRQRTELMGVALPEYKTAIDKSTKLTNVGLQMQAGRRPGTMAEGIWQQKQKQVKKVLPAANPFLRGVKLPESKKEVAQPKYQRNAKTGQTRVSYDGGKTWQTIG
jgi:hypothetical protein